MHDDVIRSLKRVALLRKRMSSDDVRDHIDSRWYELVLACDGESSLQASMFSPRYRLPSRSRGTRR